ncbi:MAG: hypothetical protein WDA27_07165 [Actinomycetota bacterium]
MSRILVSAMTVLLLILPAVSESSPDTPTTSVTAVGDGVFLEVSHQVPEFAGAFVDEALHRVYVGVVGGDRALAIQAADALFDVVGDLRTFSVIGVASTYRFEELKTWQARATQEVLSMPGAVSTDVAERDNVVRIEVDGTPEQVAAIEARLAEVGIPTGAIKLARGRRPQFRSNLQDYHRPMVGGLKIETLWGWCTLGFNAKMGTMQGFVTNSHCTDTWGGEEGTVMGQPVVAVWVGTEERDPEFAAGIMGCPTGRVCRYSDSAFFSLQPTATVEQGKIASASSTTGDPPPVPAWNGTSKYTVKGETAPISGRGIAKVGASSGYSSGTVTGTCLDINVDETNITLLCQYVTNAFSYNGDSGSAMIAREGLPVGDVNLKGILWGGPKNDWNTSYFSAIGNIQLSTELGPLNTCAAGSC